jgi:membrane protease YdiL (CAAX protease family)
MDASDLGIVPGSWQSAAAWFAGLTVVGMAIVFGARALKVPETAFLLRLIPVTPRERMIFAGLSVTAGFSEELVFRGFMIHALTTVTGSIAFAIVASTLVFSWMHAYQGAAGAIGAGLLGALLAIPVAVSGTILPSMMAHAAIDVLAGIVFRHRLYDGLA